MALVNISRIAECNFLIGTDNACNIEVNTRKFSSFKHFAVDRVILISSGRYKRILSASYSAFCKIL